VQRERRSRRYRIRYLLVQLVAQVGARHGSESGVFLRRNTQAQGMGLELEKFEKGFGDRFNQNKTLGGDAALSAVEKARGHTDGRRLLEIGIRQDNECIRAAEFEHGFLEVYPAAAATFSRPRRRPWSVTAWMRGSAMTCPVWRGRNHKRAEYTLGEAGFVENLFDGESALRNVRGVFQHRRVACHEAWRGSGTPARTGSSTA
jgi:hypothetical protein